MDSACHTHDNANSNLMLDQYCKTINVSVPFISRISQAKQNREIKGREYQLQTKIGRNYYSISNCMVLIHQNEGAKIILHAKSPTFRAAKLKGFTVRWCVTLGNISLPQISPIRAEAIRKKVITPDQYIGYWHWLYTVRNIKFCNHPLM